MPASPLLVVGLGNPGREYASTRHNVGWMALDELASRSAADAFRKKFSGEYAKGEIEGRPAIFLRPETYMNESGKSVQPAAAFFHVAPGDVVVLHDELDLPFGDVRVKVSGGHAGHNGLRSLIAHLGTPDFVRVRVGIGRPPPGFQGDVADFVLSSFDAVEKASVPDLVAKAVASVRTIAKDGAVGAMNHTNARAKGGIATNTRPKAVGEKTSGGGPRPSAP